MGTFSVISARVTEEEVGPTRAAMPLSRVNVDQLYWLGRYSERVYTTLKAFFAAYDNSDDALEENLQDFCRALDIQAQEGEDTAALVERILYDKSDPSSVCSSMRAAFSNALVLRPELGTSVTSHIELALTNLKSEKSPEGRLKAHRSVGDNLLAFWGAVEDSVESSEAKAIIFFGKYVERVELWSRFGTDEQLMDRPVRKLIFYLGYIKHPESLPVCAALGTLISNLEARGYGEFVVNRLRQVQGLISE